MKNVIALSLVALTSAWLISAAGCADDGTASTNDAVVADSSEGADTTPMDAAPAVTCVEDGEICITLKMPATLDKAPVSLIIAFYDSLPPMTPPSIFPPYQVKEEDLTALNLTAGMVHTFKLTDVTATGSYLPYIVLYMPEGGLASWMPLAGVDYVVSGDTAIALDGKAKTIDGVWELTVAE